jgi:hypothetical protein
MSDLRRKACIEANSTFDFLKEVVAHVPDLGNEAKEEKGAGRPRKRYVALMSDAPPTISTIGVSIALMLECHF